MTSQISRDLARKLDESLMAHVDREVKIFGRVLDSAEICIILTNTATNFAVSVAATVASQVKPDSSPEAMFDLIAAEIGRRILAARPKALELVAARRAEFAS